MTPLAIVEIVKLSLQITLEIIQSIPLEQRQAMAKQAWDDHQRNMEFWRNLLDKK